MEKLIVKNFGPIKEAEIDLTKYVVFIGDTSTGKSVLAKLISIFRDNIFKLTSKNNKDTNLHLFKNDLKKYNIDFNIKKTEILYYTGDLLTFSLINNELIFHTEVYIKDSFNNFFNELFNNLNTNTDFKSLIDIDEVELKKLVLKEISNKSASIYIPAERILYSMIGNSINGLWSNNISISECYKEFAANYETARIFNKNINFKEFGVNYSFEDGTDKIKINKNKLNLSQASSGIQSLIPLLLVLEREINIEKNKYDRNFLIEEPELNLFPIKQKKLIEHIINQFHSTNDKLIITTHSPYVLSVLDTLILANNTFKENPNLLKEISSVISKEKWIDYNDISVYEVKDDGKIYSIKNDEFKSIDANAIDSVSDIISEEFEKLTDLRYAH